MCRHYLVKWSSHIVGWEIRYFCCSWCTFIKKYLILKSGQSVWNKLLPAFQCGVYMFSQPTRRFYLGVPVSSHRQTSCGSECEWCCLFVDLWWTCNLTMVHPASCMGLNLCRCNLWSCVFVLLFKKKCIKKKEKYTTRNDWISLFRLTHPVFVLYLFIYMYMWSSVRKGWVALFGSRGNTSSPNVSGNAVSYLRRYSHLVCMSEVSSPI